MLRPVYSLITGDLRTAAGCPLFDYFFGVIMNNFKKQIKEIQRKFPNKSYVIDNFYNGVKKNLEIRKNRVKNKTNKDFNFWKDDDIDVIY